MSPERPKSALRRRPQVMTLTDRAAERINTILASKQTGLASKETGLASKQTAGAGLRIGVKKGGCAGMEYTMEWAGEPQPHDEVVEHNGARVLIDPKAVMYLLGAEMDYRVDKLAAQFVFSNPNQSSACGCGESVNLTPASEDKLEALRG
ncbi:MAG TPA: iron-sulfur cluster assembly accessory protein [Hyphomicrobiaceae bacterium]|jgi:iron-sulfur cluster assembly protein|nr:iron-sulfur cluster assembly accessory protein [Hyphomicrobiaceae bacterium]